MLRIEVPSAETQINREIFERFNIPSPPNWTDTEINGNLIFLFDDEEQAVTYLDALEDFAGSTDNESPARAVLNTLITTINNDGFVQAYLR
jgi:hypothetical protein